ncbi:MAG: DUF1616 domain-containing protein, partial [Methanothrix sp.]
MAGSRDLFAIVVFVVISAIFIIVPPLNETPLRAVLGFILVLFVPGYVFVTALFPGSDELNGIERLALSIGLSICIAVFIGIALNYSMCLAHHNQHLEAHLRASSTTKS